MTVVPMQACKSDTGLYFGKSADGAFGLIAEHSVEAVKAKALPMLQDIKAMQDKIIASGETLNSRQPRLVDPIEVTWVD